VTILELKNLSFKFLKFGLEIKDLLLSFLHLGPHLTVKQALIYFIDIDSGLHVLCFLTEMQSVQSFLII
jgi:hypothetical protein